jgi:hypothetical protein
MAGESKHPDRLTALASGFAALLALAVSTYNVILQRQQIRAQVWPHLRWSYSQGERFTVQVSNEGVGPAIIKTVQLSVDKQPLPDWSGALDKLGLSIEERGFSTIATAVIPAGSQVTMMTVPNDKLSDKLAAAFGKRLILDVCYCSVLDDCWDLRGPRQRCPPVALPFEQ